MKARRFIFAIALFACGDDSKHIAWPELGVEVRSIVILLEDAAGETALSAHPVHQTPKLEIDSGTSVLMLGYAEPIESIGAGPLDPRQAQLGCLLGFPRSVWRLAASSAAFEMSQLDPEERTLLSGGRSCFPCLDFEERRIDLETTESTLGVRLPSGAALVQIQLEAEAGQRLVSVGREGVPRPLTGCENRGYRSGVAQPSGVVWLGAADGRLERVQIDETRGSCTVALSTQTPSLEGLARGTLNSLALRASDGRTEVLAGSETGRLDAFEETAGWTSLGSLAPEAGSTHRSVTVLSLGADEAVMSLGTAQLLFTRRGQPPQVQDVELGPPLDVSRPSWITTLGPSTSGFLIGDSEGRVSRWRDSGVPETIPLPSELAEVGFIRARGAGLVALTEGGRVMQVNDGGGACAEVYSISGSFRSVPRAGFVETDGSIFVADSVKAGGRSIVVWLTPR